DAASKPGRGDLGGRAGTTGNDRRRRRQSCRRQSCRRHTCRSEAGGMAAAVICRGDSVKGAATCRKVVEEAGAKLPKMKKRFCSVDCRNKRKRRLEASEYPRMKVE